MSRATDLGNKLYSGEVSYPIVARRRLWYSLSAVLLLVALGGLLLRGMEFGIEFRGGAEFRFTSAQAQESAIREVVTGEGVTAQRVLREGGDTWRVQTETLSSAETSQVRAALAGTLGLEEVSTQSIGPSWGGDVSRKAVQALLVFLALVVVYLSVTFEWRMAAAAVVALLHDVFVTIGIYALVGFEVTPASVIGLLTILGYSLYDTVVVFDKVAENTRGVGSGSRATYSEAANLAVNQTLVRSLNTSVIALLPIGSILFIASFLLGAGTLKDLSLALFIGVAAGTYSSVFIATPLLVQLKEREPAMRELADRVATRRRDRAGDGRTGGAPGTGSHAMVVGVSAGPGPDSGVATLDQPVAGNADDIGRPRATGPAGAPVGGGRRPRRASRRRPAPRRRR